MGNNDYHPDTNSFHGWCLTDCTRLSNKSRVLRTQPGLVGTQVWHRVVLCLSAHQSWGQDVTSPGKRVHSIYLGLIRRFSRSHYSQFLYVLWSTKKNRAVYKLHKDLNKNHNFYQGAVGCRIYGYKFNCVSWVTTPVKHSGSGSQVHRVPLDHQDKLMIIAM